MEAIVSWVPEILPKIIFTNKNVNEKLQTLSSPLTYFCKEGFTEKHRYITQRSMSAKYSNLLSPHYYGDFYKSFRFIVFNVGIVNKNANELCSHFDTQMILYFTDSAKIPEVISKSESSSLTSTIPEGNLKFSYLKLIQLDFQLAQLNPRALEKISQYFSDIKVYNENVSNESYQDSFFKTNIPGEYFKFIFNLFINQKDAAPNERILLLAKNILSLHKKIALDKSAERFFYDSFNLDQRTIIRDIPINFHDLPQQISDDLIKGEEKLLNLAQQCWRISEEMKLLIRLG